MSSTKVPSTKTGIQLIAEERHRQIYEKEYDPLHDKKFSKEELLNVAVSYALPLSYRDKLRGTWKVPLTWPWKHDKFKPLPNDRVKDLMKAGALIAAEIDRIRLFGEAK